MITDNLSKSYRPVLTGYEVSALISTLKSNPSLLGSSEHLMNALRKLSIFYTKIEMEMIAPIADNIVKPTISSQLLDDYSAEPKAKPDYKAIRLAAFNKWSIDPIHCSIKELEDVETYRFENGLMDSIELEEFNVRLMKEIPS